MKQRNMPFYTKGYVQKYIPLESDYFYPNQREEYLRSIKTERLWRHRRKIRGDKKSEFFKRHKSAPFKSFGSDWFEKDGRIFLSEFKIPIKWEHVRYATAFFDEGDKVNSTFDHFFTCYKENIFYKTTLRQALQHVIERRYQVSSWPYKFLTNRLRTPPPEDSIITFKTPTVFWLYIPNCNKCRRCQARLIDRYWNMTSLEIQLNDNEAELLHRTLDKIIPFMYHNGYETSALEKVKILHLYDADGCYRRKDGQIFLDTKNIVFASKLIGTLIHEAVHASRPEKREKEIVILTKQLVNKFEIEQCSFLEEIEKFSESIVFNDYKIKPLEVSFI